MLENAKDILGILLVEACVKRVTTTAMVGLLGKHR